MENKLLVIGAGPGGESGLTGRAREAIAKTERVYAAARRKALVPPESFCPLEPLSAAITAIRSDLENGKSAAVLVSDGRLLIGKTVYEGVTLALAGEADI